MRVGIAVSLSLVLTACPSKTTPSAQPEATPATQSSAGAPARYLALGDSYTIGESVEVSERWPVQLTGLLSTAGVKTSEPVIVARTGWTTGDLLAGLERAAPKGPFDLVTLLIGVNNQFRGLAPEAYRKEVRVLLKRAIALAGGRARRVVVLSTPDWGVTPFARRHDAGTVAREIDAFNAIEAQEAKALGLAWVDVTAISRRAKADPTLVARDGLHPSGRMYRLWAEAALPTVKAALAD